MISKPSYKPKWILQLIIFLSSSMKVVLQVFVSAKCTDLPKCKHIREGVKFKIFIRF